MGNTMSSAVANKLLDELGLTNLMNPVPCDRYNPLEYLLILLMAGIQKVWIE